VKTRSKLNLCFMGIAAVIVAQAAVFMWQSHALWHEFAQLSDTAGAEASRLSTVRAMAIGLAAFVLALMVTGVLRMKIAGQIGRLTETARALAKGDLNQNLEVRGKDELGLLAEALNKIAEDLRQTKGALGQAKTTMNERVAERASELEEAHERLRKTQFELVQREKMSMLGQLAAGMAHEVNTPTAAILNASADANDHLRDLLAFTMRPQEFPGETRQWLAGMFDALFGKGRTRNDTDVRGERRRLERRLRGEGCSDPRRMAEVIVACGMTEMADDEGFRQRFAQADILSVLEHALSLKASADISEASARKIARIVRSLRFYAHDSHGELSDIDVNETIDNTLAIMQNRIKHTARVETHFQEDLPSVECGADLLQVWTNILSNACDAIEESRNEGMGLIEITTALREDRVVVAISNEGKPIPDEVIAKIFDPFFTTKRVGKGTGLGLSICLGILERYEGQMRAVNGDGRVTFEVALPTTASRHSGTKAPEAVLMGRTISSEK